MTAEIVVMNREAVALAADSAVTIGEGPKVLNTVNKIFMLAPKHSVGILLYNNPHLMHVPWEILIKDYRDHIVENKIEISDLEDYAKGFLTYIEQNGSRFVIKEQELAYLNLMIFSEYKELSWFIWSKIKDIFYQRAEISEEEINNIIVETIENYFTYWSSCTDILPQESAITFRSDIHSRYRAEIEKMINYWFENFPLTDADNKKLIDIGLYKVSKRGKEPDSILPFTGVVFAGYGRDNLFPVCISYEVYYYLCDTLVYREWKKCRIGFSEENPTAAIIPFAQDDVVINIIDGRLEDYEHLLMHELSKKLTSEEVGEIIKQVNDIIMKKHTLPIINTIDVLPKDELASVARTFVNITSFMRRVSSDVETVGGPVDVGVISKKDGFVWIDRKHYFDIDKNLHYSGR